VDNEFENLEKLTKKSIAIAKGSRKNFGKQFNDIKSSISAEVDRVRKSFALKVLSIELERQAKVFVRHHQFALIALLNELFDEVESKSRSGQSNRNLDSAKRFQEIDLILVSLLEYIKDSFPDLFNLNADIPRSSRENILLEAMACSDQLESNLTRYLIDPALRNLLLGIFSEFLKAHSRRIPFRQVSCIRELFNQTLAQLGILPDRSPIDAQIRKVLMSVDCNHVTCIRHYEWFLSNELLKCETISDKIELLAFYLKTVNQVRTLPHCKFDVEQPSLKTQVSEWLAEEMVFYEKKRQLGLGTSGKPDELVAGDFKLILDLSVAQFAYLIKVLTETGVIQNKNQSEVFRFLVRFIKTKRSENISYDSFRTRYFNAESNTKGAVINLLHTCIGHVEAN
jgi:hypothetical protein